MSPRGIRQSRAHKLPGAGSAGRGEDSRAEPRGKLREEEPGKEKPEKQRPVWQVENQDTRERLDRGFGSVSDQLRSHTGEITAESYPAYLAEQK